VTTLSAVVRRYDFLLEAETHAASSRKPIHADGFFSLPFIKQNLARMF
jgi:hypothetical protein